MGYEGGVTFQLAHKITPTSLLVAAGRYARTMGLKAVYTDHSLFGFNDAASIHLNKVRPSTLPPRRPPTRVQTLTRPPAHHSPQQLLKFTLSDAHHAIAVSHTCRENLVLRASLHPLQASYIDTSRPATGARLCPAPLQ